VSYASLPLEGVDWTPFDIIATDAAYRSAGTAANFRESVRAFVAQGRAQGKPVAATEFGCATYTGAGNVANYVDMTIVWDENGRATRLNGDFIRNEDEQATDLRELLDVFDGEGVDAAFLYTFARYDLPHRDGSQEDLDMASAAVVKVFDRQSGARDSSTRRYPDMPWEPKAAFDALADRYSR
jgi:hypothetical protein